MLVFSCCPEFGTPFWRTNKGFLSFYPISYEEKAAFPGFSALSFAGGVTSSTALFRTEKGRCRTCFQIRFLDPSEYVGGDDAQHHRCRRFQGRENRAESHVLLCCCHRKSNGKHSALSVFRKIESMTSKGCR